MKERGFVRVTSLLLAVVMLASLAACTGSGPKATEATTTAAGTTTQAPSTPEGPSWTWDTSPWELGEWYIGVSSVDMKYDPEKKIVDKAIYEATGMKNVTWTTSPTDADEKLSAMIASRNLPDVITIVNNARNREKIDLIQGNYAEEILPLIDQYAPTMRPELSQDIIDWWSAEDGKWYAFPNSSAYTGREVRPMNSIPKIYSFARQDIMKQLDIKPEDFITQDGFVEALKKVKNAGITRNGVPIMPFMGGELPDPFDYANWLAMNFAVKYEDRDGNYLTRYQAAETWEFMQFLNRLFREGFITEQHILMKTAEAREIVLKDGIFMGFCHDGIKDQAKTRAKETNGDIYYASIENPRNSKGEDPIFISTGVSATYTLTFITKTAKNKDRIIKLFDFLNSKEGNILSNYGVEGVTYDWVDALVPQTGKIEKVIKEKDEYKAELTADQAATKKKYGTKEFFMIQDRRYYESLLYQKPYEEEELQEQMIRDIQDFNGERGDRGNRYALVTDCVNETALNPDAETEEAEIRAKISVYMKEQGMKLLTAKTEAEYAALKEEAMKRINDMGLQKLQEAMNKKFQALKAKLGIKYVYPQNAK